MNPENVHYFNMFLGVGAIILQLFSVTALFLVFFGPKKNVFLDFVDKHFLPIGFFISVSAALFSLLYSEVINYAACYLCWWARVFMYPQVILFGVALWDKDRKVIKYALPLLSVGVLVSAYHNLMYYFADTGNIPCDATGVSCYQQLVSEFGGYISIPMLSLTSVFAMLTLVVVSHFYRKNNSLV
jgi:disulfide bond formation protein DsbB